VQALADIWSSALCCHSNETRAPIANPPNTAQLEGTPTIPASYIPVRAVVWECDQGQTDTQRDTETDIRRPPWPLYISRRLRLTRNVITSAKSAKRSIFQRFDFANVCSQFRLKLQVVLLGIAPDWESLA